MWHLVVLNAFVGGMVGLERTVLPGLAEREFGIASAAAATSFIVAFGLTKAFTNLFAGRLADAYGRRRVLLAGWIVGVPVPLLIMFAPSWNVVVFANVLLGVNQGLAWSMTVNMKLDLVGPERRGLVVGLNETSGYVGVAVVAFVTGFLAQPFALGVGIALVGLVLSFFVHETRGAQGAPPASGRLPSSSFLVAPSIAGLATNLKDGALWGILPLALAASGVPLPVVAAVVATYPTVWGVAQLVFGPLSDRIGRRGLAAAGLLAQAAGIVALEAARPDAVAMVAAAALIGLGTAMAYPTLLALVADRAPPQRRASALGIYRFWRDLGYAVGALGAGLAADALGYEAALWLVAGVVALAAVNLFVEGRVSPRREQGA